MLLGIDIGTTHWKSGLFALDGAQVGLATSPALSRRDAAGRPSYDPELLWDAIAALIRTVLAAHDPATLRAVGIASMAEAGLLVDRRTGRPRSPIIPWFDPRSMPQAAALARARDPRESFRRTGLHPSYKYGLAKLLWLREHDPAALQGAVWLSVADYVALRLIGSMVTDPTLAARTYAYRIDTHEWDAPWILHVGLDPALFPAVRPTGSGAGRVSGEAAATTGLPEGTPVAIAGHDHLCTAFGAGAGWNRAVDSMGTAETISGLAPDLHLDDAERESGLTYGPYVREGRACWLGGLPASGGSIEWLRRQLGDEPLPYERLRALLAAAAAGPTGILYFPYLSGSGAPRPDPHARGAFVGLSATHGRADLVKSVLEGTAFEVESIRRAAERATGSRIDELVVVGGGAKNASWVQIKADISGCRMRVPAFPETTLLGAALIAGLGCGLYPEEAAATDVAARQPAATIEPDERCHHLYRRIYEDRYVPLQESLRRYGAEE